MTSAEIWSHAVAWMATLLVHSTVLIGAVWAATRRERWIGPAWRDVLWKTALVAPLLTASLQLGAGLHPLGGQIGLPANHGLQATTAVPVDTPASTPAPPSAPVVNLEPAVSLEPSAGLERAALASATHPLPEWWPMATVFVWMFVAGGLLVHLAWRYARLRRHLSPRRLVEDESLIAETLELRRRAGIARRIAVSELEALRSPVAYGRSEICLPASMVRHTPAANLRTVLGHELAHLERGDYHWLLVASVIEEALFFQPLFRLARREMQRGAEFLCDDFAVAHGGLDAGRGLAEILAELAARHRGPASPGLGQLPAIQPGSGLLLARVERLLDADRRPSAVPSRSRRLTVAVVLGLGLLLAAPAIGTAAPPMPPEPPEAEPTAPPPPPAPSVTEADRIEVHERDGTTTVIVHEGGMTTVHTVARDDGNDRAERRRKHKKRTRKQRRRRARSRDIDAPAVSSPAPGVQVIRMPGSEDRTVIVRSPAPPAPPLPSGGPPHWTAIAPPPPPDSPHGPTPAPPAPPAPSSAPENDGTSRLELPPMPEDPRDAEAMRAWEAEVTRRAQAWERTHGAQIERQVERQLRAQAQRLRAQEKRLREQAERLRERADREREAAERDRERESGRR